MTDQQIDFFLAICENNSFSKTAMQFYVSQPTVSTQISALEKELGVILFERTKNYVSMTTAGRVYEEFFSQYRTAFLQVKKTQIGQEKEKHALNIGIMNHLYVPEIFSSISSLHLQHPNVEISIRNYIPYQSHVSLFAQDIDIILTYKTPLLEQPGVSWKTIANSRFFLAVSQSDPILLRDHVSPDDFQKHKFFLPHVTSDLGYQQMIRRIKKRFGFYNIDRRNSFSLDTICMYISCGFGVGILNEHTLRSWPNLCSLDIEESLDVIVAYQTENENLYVRKLVNALPEVDKSLF